jgi:hypothetical protein
MLCFIFNIEQQQMLDFMSKRLPGWERVHQQTGAPLRHAQPGGEHGGGGQQLFLTGASTEEEVGNYL